MKTGGIGNTIDPATITITEEVVEEEDTEAEQEAVEAYLAVVSATETITWDIQETIPR